MSDFTINWRKKKNEKKNLKQEWLLATRSKDIKGSKQHLFIRKQSAHFQGNPFVKLQRTLKQQLTGEKWEPK